MADMTEAEYDALDELWTNNPPKVSGDGKNGFFMHHKNEIVILDDVSATWLRLKSEMTHKSTTEIIGELVRKEIAAIPV
ncbi:MAG: hypothetical protein LBU99_07005 [Spirochaetaceae bacterium]|jgi:hypothetical protein|nr:hypothetical protein [Spirochaetaceae bacterium]